jgi:hypothetical protein
MIDQINRCESIKELKRYLRRKLTVRDAFQLPRTLRVLVRQDAMKFEIDGEFDNIAVLYLQVSINLRDVVRKAPPIYRSLLESSAQFWEEEAKKADIRANKLRRVKKEVVPGHSSPISIPLSIPRPRSKSSSGLKPKKKTLRVLTSKNTKRNSKPYKRTITVSDNQSQEEKPIVRGSLKNPRSGSSLKTR